MVASVLILKVSLGGCCQWRRVYVLTLWRSWLSLATVQALRFIIVLKWPKLDPELLGLLLFSKLVIRGRLALGLLASNVQSLCYQLSAYVAFGGHVLLLVVPFFTILFLVIIWASIF